MGLDASLSIVGEVYVSNKQKENGIVGMSNKNGINAIRYFYTKCKAQKYVIL